MEKEKGRTLKRKKRGGVGRGTVKTQDPDDHNGHRGVS